MDRQKDKEQYYKNIGQKKGLCTQCKEEIWVPIHFRKNSQINFCMCCDPTFEKRTKKLLQLIFKKPVGERINK